MTQDPPSDPALLVELANQRMPFGKYKGELLIDLPEAYLVWLSQKGFPRGKLGMLLESALSVKSNGLTPLLRRLVSNENRSPREKP